MKVNMESIFCVIDRSGSMATCLNDTVGGFNLFINDQPPEALITTFLFNHGVHELYRCQKPPDIKPLDSVTYRPSGSTSLLDASGSAIEVASNCTSENITMVILTDGEENTSVVYSKDRINELIDQKKTEGWKFIFMGANQDAIHVADGLGIGKGGALTFDTGCVKDAFQCMSSAIERVRTGESQDIEFSQVERNKSCPL